MAQSSNPHGAHAIVFGASGLIGWGTVEQLLNNYPAQGTFSKVTAVVNRPISITDTYWPQPTPSRPELSLVSGINLTAGGIGDFAKLLKIKVPDIGTVTHAFYWGMIFPFLVDLRSPHVDKNSFDSTSLQARQ